MVEAPYVAMPNVEFVLEHLEFIAQLVEKGEFLSREEAIEDLLSTGLRRSKRADPWTKMIDSKTTA